MKRTLVRYKIKPEQVQANARLIKQVFQETGCAGFPRPVLHGRVSLAKV
jgi:hypothetical protein